MINNFFIPIFFFPFLYAHYSLDLALTANIQKSIRKAPLKSPALKIILQGLCGILLR
jgi:hypothetical protein